MKLLSTKHLPENLKARLKDMQITLIEHNFIRVSYPDNNAAKEFASANSNIPLVFTSRNGFLAYWDMGLRTDAGVYCMNGATKQLLQQEGYKVLQSAKDSIQLAEAILNDKPKSVIYLSGNLRGDYLPQKLKEAGIIVHEFIVYETELTPVAIEDIYHAVLFFSPSAVRSFFMRNKLCADVSAYAIGPTTLAELEKHGHTYNYTPAEPDAEEMIELLIAQNI